MVTCSRSSERIVLYAYQREPQGAPAPAPPLEVRCSRRSTECREGTLTFAPPRGVVNVNQPGAVVESSSSATALLYK